MQTNNTDSLRPACGMWRRLAAMSYDLMLLFALLFIYTLALNIVLDPAIVQGSRIIYPLSLLFCCYGYYTWQWLRGGQTLGMKAWRITLVRNDGARLDGRTATLRCLLAGASLFLFGAGLWWALYDADRRTFYDRYTGTNLVRITAG